MRGGSARSVPYRQPLTLPSAAADTKHVAWRGVPRPIPAGPGVGERRNRRTCEDASVTVSVVAPYDAVLLLSFGGPEQPADVLPFLENVTHGRGIPRERLESVAEHYHHFGGRSPINDQNRALLAALRAELEARGLDVPVYWGNRNWNPYVLDTLRQARADGVQRICVIVTSAYSSYSGCRQYREDLATALLELADEQARASCPAWTRSGTTSTIRASSRRTSTPSSPASRRCPTAPGS